MPTKFKINSEQLPIKAHYFFFMAAMGPILPFLPVYGRQMGVSAVAMGMITAILPFLYLISKPIFGYIADYYRDKRKTIFVGILLSGSLAFVLFYFLPTNPGDPEKYINSIYNYTSTIFCDINESCATKNINMTESCQETAYQARHNCTWICDNEEQMNLSVVSLMITNDLGDGLVPMCWEAGKNQQMINNNYNKSLCNNFIKNQTNDSNDCFITCQIVTVDVEDKGCLYKSFRFWGFVILMSIGSISFNVTNSISDAICFDVLGEGGHMGYGRQRVWGTIGFGITALAAGYAIDYVSKDTAIKSYTPAFILIIIFTICDIICCAKLKLPVLEADNILKSVLKLLKIKTIAIFLVFATIVGIIDSFVIYFLFWYLEDLAEQTYHLSQIKLIEGLVVAAETLGGKILKKFGYGYSLTFCFICYALRFTLISLVPNPWWAILVELFMQGPTYGLCYTIIVGFASVIAPPGTSATVQGIVAGMDDGLGFAIGSLLGGILFQKIGGMHAMRVFATISAISGLSFFILYITILKNTLPKTRVDNKKQNNNILFKAPEKAIEECDTA